MADRSFSKPLCGQYYHGCSPIGGIEDGYRETQQKFQWNGASFRRIHIESESRSEHSEAVWLGARNAFALVAERFGNDSELSFTMDPQATSAIS